MQSEQVTDLLPALSAAIAEMRAPKKNAANPHFKNRFADLSEVLDCVREPLHDAGLVMTQTVQDDALVTRVWHCKTGQWIESRVPLILDKPTAQAQGSAITYAKRYAIKAFFGMADDDDDGNAASGTRTQAKPTSRPAPRNNEPVFEPFATVEHAVAAANDIDGPVGLKRWAAIVKVSRFKGEDHALAVATYKDVEERLAIAAERNNS